MIAKLVHLKPTQTKEKFKLFPKQKFLIMPVGDIHWGSPGFPREKFLEDIQWAYDRGAYFLGMGDHFDHTPESQRKCVLPMRDGTKETFEKEAIHDVQDLVSYIGYTKGRWLGLLEGNHRVDFRSGKTSDTLLCEQLGCDFLGSMAILRLTLKETHPEGDFIIVAHHGVGGTGTTMGGQLNKPESLLKFMGADLVLMGHSHAKLVGSIDRLTLTPDGKFYSRSTLVARTGAYLKAYDAKDPLSLDDPAYMSRGSYVEEKALMPSSMGAICFAIGAEKIKDSIYWKPIVKYVV